MMSPWEVGVIAVVVVLLFGTKRLPELGSGLGKAISNFRKSYREGNAIDVTPDTNQTTTDESTKKVGDANQEKKETQKETTKS